MISAKLTPDNNWIIVSSSSEWELRQIKLDFCKKYDNWFILRKKSPIIPIEENFMNDYNMIPVGLWLELVNTCIKFKIKLNFTDDFNQKIKNCEITKEQFVEYVNILFKNNDSIQPKDYQIDGCYNVITYKKCCMEVATSGGKTLMSYIIFKYLTEVLHKKHILFITPNTNLTTQTVDKFKLYDEKNGVVSTWTSAELHAKAKKKEKYNETIIFANYQSACRKKIDFFKMFDILIIDECQHTSNNSIINIIRKSKNAEYKIGMTGTFPKDGTFKNFLIQANIGPVVYKLSSYKLINEENFATPVHVRILILDYLENDKKEALYNLRKNKDKDDPTAGSKLLNSEKYLMRSNITRFNYILKILKSTTKNTLAIFSDVQDEYGRKYYNNLKENTNKNVYYIAGETDPAVRKNIINNVENDITGNSIIIASMGCFSEGIDIANIWNIFLLEDTKSDNILAQILGRGMRRYKGKDKTIMLDFVDDYRYNNGYYENNYLYVHGQERIEIYKQRGFPYEIYQVSLLNK